MSQMPHHCQTCDLLSRANARLEALVRALLSQQEDALAFVAEAAKHADHPKCRDGEQWLRFRQELREKDAADIVASMDVAST